MPDNQLCKIFKGVGFSKRKIPNANKNAFEECIEFQDDSDASPETTKGKFGKNNLDR